MTSSRRVFVSHNSRDKHDVRFIAETLIDAHQVDTWLDEWAIAAATDWQAEIDATIASCSSAIVTLSEHGFGPIHGLEAARTVERQDADSTFVVVPIVLVRAGVGRDATLQSARRNSAPETPEELFDLFRKLHSLTYPIVDGRIPEKEAVVGELAEALLRPGVAPHPFGPDVRTPVQIRRDARLWSRGKGALYAGEVLAEAIEQRKTRPGEFDPLSQQFLDACTARQQQFRARWLRGLAVAVVLLVGAVGGIALLYARSESARSQAETALRQASGRSAILQASTRDEQGSLLDAIRAASGALDDHLLPQEAIQAIWLAVDAARRSARLDFACSSVTAPALSADGRYLLVIDTDSKSRFIDTSWNEEIPDASGLEATSVALSEDGRDVWLGGQDGTVRMLRPFTPSPPIPPKRVCAKRVAALAVTNGELDVACEERTVKQFASTRLGLVPQWETQTSQPVTMLRRTGEHLLALGLETLLIRPNSGSSLALNDIRLSGDIDDLAGAVGENPEGSLRRCDVRSAQCGILGTLNTNGDRVASPVFGMQGTQVFASTGRRLVVTSSSGLAERLADFETPHRYIINQVAASKFSNRLVSVDIGGECRVWRVDGDGSRATLGGQMGYFARPPFRTDIGDTRFVANASPNAVVAIDASTSDVISLHSNGTVVRWHSNVASVQWAVPRPQDAEPKGCVGTNAAGVIDGGRLRVTDREGEKQVPGLGFLFCHVRSSPTEL